MHFFARTLAPAASAGVETTYNYFHAIRWFRHLHLQLRQLQVQVYGN